MSLCSKEAKNGIYSECLSVVSEKDEHGTVTKDDWMHIVNKHSSLSGFASRSQPLHKDVPYNILSSLRRLDGVSLRWRDRGGSWFDPVWPCVVTT